MIRLIKCWWGLITEGFYIEYIELTSEELEQGIIKFNVWIWPSHIFVPQYNVGKDFKNDNN